MRWEFPGDIGKIYTNETEYTMGSFGELKNRQGERIDYTESAGDKYENTVVVIGHGVTGNKDRPFLVALGEGLADRGMTNIRISFTGNGDSEGRFEDCHISKEVEDLGSVLDQLGDRRVIYIGHSMGGAVGVIRASQDNRIKALVSVAGMVHTKQFAEIEFGGEEPGKGFMWEEESCPLSQAFMDDLRTIKSLESKGSEISVPWLLIHGTEDDVVPIGDSEDILRNAGENADLIKVRGANHVFAEPHTAELVKHVGDWLERILA